MVKTSVILTKTTESKRNFKTASKVLVGGVNSPVRAFHAVGGTPIFFNHAKGPYLFDVDGNRYIDYCQSWGALILGHAAKPITDIIQRQAARGTSFGASTPPEAELAQLLKELFPSCDRFRFTNSGTEAVMTAVRLARGITRKSRIIKFEGCYHGHVDSLLVKAGSGLATGSQATSAGIPRAFTNTTTVLPYNDTHALEMAFRRYRDIACVIVEPVAGNMGLIPANRSFLQKARTLTRKTGALLIFDEVITGLRVGISGAQKIYAITPDITTLGKVIGGGLPVGALGGKSRVMRYLAPDGPVYQAGTLSGNPLSIGAGIRTLSIIRSKAFQNRLNRNTRRFARDLQKAFDSRGMISSVPSIGSIFSIFFMKKAPQNFSDITEQHVKTYAKFFRHMLKRGIYFPPSAFEAMFVSSAHKSSDFEKTLRAIGDCRL